MSELQQEVENKIQVLRKGTDLDQSTAQRVLSAYESFFKQAADWERKAKAIVVTSTDDKESMKQAREVRLALKNMRVDAKKKHDELKKKSLIEGKFIDSIYNIFAGIVTPLEDHLIEQEKYVERIEKERLDKVESERKGLLEELGVNTGFYDLRSMEQEQFDELLEQSKEQKKHREEVEARAAEERRKEEAAAREREKKNRIEKDRMRQLMQAGYQYEGNDLAEMSQEAFDKLLGEKQKELEESKAAMEREAHKQRIERLRVDRKSMLLKYGVTDTVELGDLGEMPEAEFKEILDRAIKEYNEEQERIAEEEREKKRLAAAPDRDKLLHYADQIWDVSRPELDSQEAKDLVELFDDELKELLSGLRTDAAKLGS